MFETLFYNKKKLIFQVTYSQHLKREISQDDERNLKSMENDTFNINSLIVGNGMYIIFIL